MKDGVTTVLFDLDGTLLPMELEEFTNTYFGLLAKQAAPYGYEPKSFIAAVWKGTGAMVKNDGSRSNADAFWQTFAAIYGEKALAQRPVFDAFYANEFNGARAATRPTPLAKRLVDGLRAKGVQVVLATNPLFPLVAVETRLGWLGLKGAGFAFITSYENSFYCKPNPRYFEEILKTIGKKPEECLMVGNDATEDLAARDVGIETYLITDCLVDKEGKDLTDVPHGTFAQLFDYLGVAL